MTPTDATLLPDSPLVFEPIFMERIWGGRRLEQLYHKKLVPGARIGESWEIVDREEAQSVVHDGPLRGQTLHELWTHRREEIFGPGLSESERFPLLVKMLDAQERLSLQVHPPADLAAGLGGEPKTEMWYLAHADAGAEVFAGLAEPTNRAKFEDALHDGRAADLVQRLPVADGDAIFIPSGRIHAIGAGCLIVEIQQNSDTTYRVFDWNRVGLDGRPRTLHVEQSLQSTDFGDVRPGLQPRMEGPVASVASCSFFHVEKWTLDAPRVALENSGGRFAIFTCLTGGVECSEKKFGPGDFFLLPANLAPAELRPTAGGTTLLRTTVPLMADDFLARVASLGLAAGDFEESFARSGGPGGQHVNKVSTAVTLRHRPTGLSVTVQDSRSQSFNRQLARVRLLDAIEQARQTAQQARRDEREKTRRQNRPRPRALKRRILQGKRHRAGIKQGRKLKDEG